MYPRKFEKHFFPLTPDGETLFDCAVERSLKLSKCETKNATLKARIKQREKALDEIADKAELCRYGIPELVEISTIARRAREGVE